MAPVTTAPRRRRRPPPARSAPAKNPANGGGTSALAALAKVEKQVQRERWGDPNGDPEGDSDEGTEGERYQALLQRALHDNFTAPGHHPGEGAALPPGPGDHLDRGRRASSAASRSSKPSGNPVFDAALERAIRATRAPPPPDADRRGTRPGASP